MGWIMQNENCRILLTSSWMEMSHWHRKQNTISERSTASNDTHTYREIERQGQWKNTFGCGKKGEATRTIEWWLWCVVHCTKHDDSGFSEAWTAQCSFRIFYSLKRFFWACQLVNVLKMCAHCVHHYTLEPRLPLLKIPGSLPAYFIHVKITITTSNTGAPAQRNGQSKWRCLQHKRNLSHEETPQQQFIESIVCLEIEIRTLSGSVRQHIPKWKGFSVARVKIFQIIGDNLCLTFCTSGICHNLISFQLVFWNVDHGNDAGVPMCVHISGVKARRCHWRHQQIIFAE